ncbi:MAG: hypothetical protein HGA33_00855 [Candidatus Moranbacteria bacterium]|nr:hypothetical protein [Candidatus Moranbacteria bacterium]
MAKLTKEELVRENARLIDENRRLRSERDSESKRADNALETLINQFCIEFDLGKTTWWNEDRLEKEIKSTHGMFAYVGRVIGENNILRKEIAWLHEMLIQTTEKEFQSERRGSVILKDMELSRKNDMKFPG